MSNTALSQCEIYRNALQRIQRIQKGEVQVRSRNMAIDEILAEVLIPKPEEIDFTVTGGGTIYLLQPHTAAATEWIAEHISDDAQFMGDAVAVEHRYIGNIVQGIQRDGLTVR